MTQNGVAAFQRGDELTMTNPKYRHFVFEFLDQKIRDDWEENDLTTEALFSNAKLVVNASIVSRRDGIVAGLEELITYLKEQRINFKTDFKDGQPIHKGAELALLSGSVEKILAIERTALDFLGRMSGIATLTHRLVKEAGPARLAGTRKTLWGLLDKKAIYIGGGLTHRLGLWDGILIKDNHLQGLRQMGVPIRVALEKAFAYASRHSIPLVEVEAETIDEVEAAIDVFQKSKSNSFVFTILLDNFSPAHIRKIVTKVKRRKLNKKILFEASGGINEKKLKQYAKTGVDLISMGRLTHSAASLDFGLRINAGTR